MSETPELIRRVRKEPIAPPAPLNPFDRTLAHPVGATGLLEAADLVHELLHDDLGDIQAIVREVIESIDKLEPVRMRKGLAERYRSVRDRLEKLARRRFDPADWTDGETVTSLQTAFIQLATDLLEVDAGHLLPGSIVYVLDRFRGCPYAPWIMHHLAELEQQLRGLAERETLSWAEEWETMPSLRERAKQLQRTRAYGGGHSDLFWLREDRDRYGSERNGEPPWSRR